MQRGQNPGPLSLTLPCLLFSLQQLQAQRAPKWKGKDPAPALSICNIQMLIRGNATFYAGVLAPAGMCFLSRAIIFLCVEVSTALLCPHVPPIAVRASPSSHGSGSHMEALLPVQIQLMACKERQWQISLHKEHWKINVFGIPHKDCADHAPSEMNKSWCLQHLLRHQARVGKQHRCHRECWGCPENSQQWFGHN